MTDKQTDLQLAAAGVILAACDWLRSENEHHKKELREAVKVFRMEEEILDNDTVSMSTL